MNQQINFRKPESPYRNGIAVCVPLWNISAPNWTLNIHYYCINKTGMQSIWGHVSSLWLRNSKHHIIIQINYQQRIFIFEALLQSVMEVNTKSAQTTSLFCSFFHSFVNFHTGNRIVGCSVENLLTLSHYLCINQTGTCKTHCHSHTLVSRSTYFHSYVN